jgi:AbrB family looped-hinge helix DNA binding protein
MGHVSLPSGSVSAAFRVGPKGRIVLPSAVRRAARIEEGAEVVARLLGEGQLLIETKDAVRARVWGAAPEPAGLDTTADVRALRSEDIALVAKNAARQAELSSTEQDSDAAGAALLAHLGL